MPEPKICIPIAEDSLEAVHRAISTLEAEGVILEIRLDSLSNTPSVEELKSLRSSSRLIFTLRPTDQGGRGGLNPEHRITFWKSISGNISSFEESTMFDIEHDIISEHTLPKHRVIASIHSFEGDIENKSEMFSNLAAFADTVKLAWTVDDAGQSLEVFHLLDITHDRGRGLIPIAMGEAGKMSRVLAVAKGAPFSYCSAGGSKATAPGQIEASEISSLYRLDSLSSSTTVFGLIAGDTSYSLSPLIHNSTFARSGADAVFLPMQTRDIEGFLKRILSGEFPYRIEGFAVTNPFKVATMKLADELDPTAVEVGAVNTLKIVGGKSIGFNTDVAGFINPLKRRLGNLSGSRIAIIGTGGAGRAAIVALLREGCSIMVFGRSRAKLDELARDFPVETALLSSAPLDGFRVIVNATPLGTAGHLRAMSPTDATQLADAELVYDLVYNPMETRFLSEGRKAGCEILGGLEMLVDQAVEQQRIWTGTVCDRDLLIDLLSERLSRE